MAHIAPLHIAIPQSSLVDPSNSDSPSSPDYFQPKEESSYSFTRNGTQYLASPSSMTDSAPMMTPVPYKLQSVLGVNAAGAEDRKKMSEFEFPAAGTKRVESTLQSYLNHPFMQLRQQRLQEQQEQLKSKEQQPPQTYASKYASYTNSSQTKLQVSPSPASDDKKMGLYGYQKPSTTSALSAIEKEKMAPRCPSNRDSMVSPPPPYLSSDHGDAAACPLNLSPSSPSGPIITSASLVATRNKRNSLPASVAPASIALNPSSTSLPVARTARELKRHSLPVTSSAKGPQWPSAMTMTMAAVTRPKLAKTMPPQAIPILYSGAAGEPKSPLSTVSSPAVFTPRTSRIMEKSELETLYDFKAGHRSSLLNGTRTRSLNLAGIQHPRASAREQFPGYWEDAKHHRMHWMVYAFGPMAVGSLIWAFMMPALLIWAAALPGVLVLALGTQYGGYRWRRRKHYKQQLRERQPSATALSSMRAASAALTHSRSSSTMVMAPNANFIGGIAVKGHGATAHAGHARRPSHSSMHTSVGSISNESFLEPHRPTSPHNSTSQVHRQYYQASSPRSTTSPSVTHFAEGYSHYPPQSPSPEYRLSWQDHQSLRAGSPLQVQIQSQNRSSRTTQRQGSSSSTASSETVSSSSTASEMNTDRNFVGRRNSARDTLMLNIEPKSPVDPAVRSQLPSSASSSPPSSPCMSPLETSMLPPPPAYVSRKCEEMMLTKMASLRGRTMSMGGDMKGAKNVSSFPAGEELCESVTLSEKAQKILSLPEIAPMGDLASEFAIDFGAYQY
ncbi:hypothetical protein BG011_003792 [Mortierella polycephala]|uniref:Uncharacterized protein n=1 Tax=Mortierella polycephala TaxID=41804 RepID=A0A9P6Q391_9FUNG|nr:hypothetical protein BG011_003792 [Mortierella polycephala]